jgi:hypothetical protein
MLENFRRGEALVSEGSDFEASRSFGEAVSLGVAHKRAVEPVRWSGPEGAVEEDLAGGGGKEIGAADDFRDGGQDVINHHSELIGGDVIAVPHQKIAKVSSRHFLNRAKISVHETNRFVVGHAESPVHA